MPFQDIEETTTTLPRVPSPAELWLRKMFLEDWGLKLLALAITMVLWLAVTGQNAPVTQRIEGVQLNFLRHEGLEISNDPTPNVEVTVKGSPSLLDQMKLRDLVVTVDISDQKPGERVIRLSPDGVKMDLPAGVKILGFRPATVPIRLAPTVEQEVPVEIKFEGKLPEGFEITTVTTSPARVRVRGPADRLGSVSKAMTETVNLEGRNQSFVISHVSINIPDPKIDILDPTVEVRVDIAEKKRDDGKLGLGLQGSPYMASIFPFAYHP